MSTKAIIYDCVGPLLIRNPAIQLSPDLADISEKCGLVVNETMFWEEIAQSHGWSSAQNRNAQQLIAQSFYPNPNMWHFHDSIRKSYATAIINNGTMAILSLWIEIYHLDKYFNTIVNSAQLGIRKPDKRIYELAASSLGVAPVNCIFIDDNQANIDGANKVGMKGILYSPNQHSQFLQTIQPYLQMAS